MEDVLDSIVLRITSLDASSLTTIIIAVVCASIAATAAKNVVKWVAGIVAFMVVLNLYDPTLYIAAKQYLLTTINTIIQWATNFKIAG